MITDLLQPVSEQSIGFNGLLDSQESHAELIRSVVENAAAGVIIAVLEPDGELRIVWANATFCRWTAIPVLELAGRHVSALVDLFSNTEAAGRINDAVRSNDTFVEDAVIYDRSSRRELSVEVSVSAVPNDRNTSAQFVAIVYRDTASKRTTDQQSSTSFYDALTELPNRALFINRLTHSMNRSRRLYERGGVVLSIGLDGFRMINDNFGHHIGDQLLIAVARRFEKLLRPGDTLARLAGDEFCVLLDRCASNGEVVAQRIISSLVEPFGLGDDEFFVSVGIGIAAAPSESDACNFVSAEEVLRNAEIAMYRAKKAGKSKIAVFQEYFRTESKRRQQLHNDLRHATERGELSVHYQPIYSVSPRHLCGFEALLRWDHLGLGMISPTEFIPLAEESGAIVRIGTWALNEACAKIHEWQQQFPQLSELGISVNVSAKQIVEDQFADVVLAALDANNVEPRTLNLEITESILMSDPDRVAQTLDRLRNAGVEIHIDDFGTGYSSLAYLKQFSVDSLKIDKSFVSGAGLSSGLANPEIVKTIIDLAHKLGLDVIAEGVETVEQAAELVSLHCTHTQGYLHAQALCAEAIPAFLTNAISAALHLS